MNEVLKWAGIVAAGWFTASILFAIAWALGARKILRQPPLPPNTKVTVNGQEVDPTVDAVVTELVRRNRMNGRGY